jgi:hypothetical protein
VSIFKRANEKVDRIIREEIDEPRGDKPDQPSKPTPPRRKPREGGAR